MIVNSSAGRILLVAGVIVLSLAACGRRGPPEAPPAAAAAPAAPAATAGEVIEADPRAQEEDYRAIPTIPDRPFILDALL